MPPFDSDPLESRLRQALRPQAPSRDLAPAVLARARAAVARSPRRHPSPWPWLALAATLVVAAAAGWLWHRSSAQRAQRLAAAASARQIMHALRLTAADLDRIQQRLPHSPPPRERM